jgi:hypothetical protein
MQELSSNTSSLGAVIVRKRRSNLFANILVGFGGLIVAFAVLVLVTKTPGEQRFNTQSIVAALFCGIVGGAPLALGLAWRGWNRGGSIAFHERGLATAQGTVLPYSEVDELVFSATRFFSHGRYIATHEGLTIRSHHLGAKAVAVGTRRKEANVGQPTGLEAPGQLPTLAKYISTAIANRMEKQLQAGEVIPWTPRMRITQQGIETTPAGFFSRDLRRLSAKGEGKPGDWTLVTWRQVRAADLREGVFRLWVQGESSPRVELPMGAPNLHPGYAVVASVLRGETRVVTAN